MALFHRHEITSPRYSFNVPTQNQLQNDDHESDDVFISEDRLARLVEEHQFEESEDMRVDVEPLRSDMHISHGLLATYDVSSVPVAPWCCSEEPIVSGNMFAIPTLSDLYDTGEGILGVVMKEDRVHEVEVDTHRWGYSPQSYDPGYFTPMRMLDYYDAVDSVPSPGRGDEERREEDELQDLGAEVKADGENINDDGADINGDEVVHHGEDEDEVVFHDEDGNGNVYHETTDGVGDYQVKYHVGDGDQSPKNIDSVFANSDTVKYNNDQIAGRLRRLSSYDNTVAPDDKMTMENENVYPLDNVSLKDILEKVEETNQAEMEGTNQERPNELLPLSNKLPTDGNGSNYALTPDYQMTTTSSGDTSPALRECTIGVRVTSKDSLAGLAPDWEESRSSSEDIGDHLEKLAISSISLASVQAPVIKESEGAVKTNVSFVSKLKKELSMREGLILPSLQPALMRGNGKYDKGQEMIKDGQQVVRQQEIGNEDQEQQQNTERQQEGKKTIDQETMEEDQQNSFDVLKDDQHQERQCDAEYEHKVQPKIEQQQQQQEQQPQQQQQPQTSTQDLDVSETNHELENGLEQRHDDKTNKEIENEQVRQTGAIGSASLIESEVGQALVKIEVASKQENVVRDTANLTQPEMGESSGLIIESKEGDVINENILRNEEAFIEGMSDQLADNRQLFILEYNGSDGQGIEDKTGLDRTQNEIMNKIINDNESKEEFNQEFDLHNSEGEKDEGSEQSCGHVDNLELGKYKSNDIPEGTLNVHESALSVPEGTFDVHGATPDVQGMGNDVQEGTLGAPDIAVTQDKERYCEEHNKEIKQVNLQELASSDEKLNVLSNDKNSSSDDTTESFPDNSLSEEINSASHNEKLEDVSIGKTEKLNKNISCNESRTLPQHDNGSSMKRTSSEIVVRELEDDRGVEQVVGMDRGGELNQPKPPPEGSSRRCVNAR